MDNDNLVTGVLRAVQSAGTIVVHEGSLGLLSEVILPERGYPITPDDVKQTMITLREGEASE